MTRHARQGLLVVVVLCLSLLVGALADGAGATRSVDPTPGSPAVSADETPTEPPTPTVTPTPGPVAVADSVAITRGRTVSVRVLANDTCAAARPCPRSSLTAVSIIGRPSTWTVSVVPSTGDVRITVPRTAPLGVKPVTYRITDPNGTAQAAVSVRVVAAPPDSYNPVPGTLFTHPFRKKYKERIRRQIIRTINSVPYGGQILVASWSFSSTAYRSALYNAKKRGVRVQIVLSARNEASNSDYPVLKRLFGVNATGNRRTAGSWVYRCRFSCRGTIGTMHAKIFLFSSAGHTSWITMTGSANLTDFAVDGQWNQMNTTVNRADVYNDARAVFYQMRTDRPVTPQYSEKHYPGMWMYYYPSGSARPENDFLMSALNGIKCTGAVRAGAHGRTQIRIAMYAWYENRGRWLAKRVRSLWAQGCDIRIVYGIMGNTVKQILYSPAGRGRIPMRQILLTNRDEEPIYYLHDKWIAVNGHVFSNTSLSFTLQGSFNFSDLGFHSDENFQRLYGRAHYVGYAKDFALLWSDPQARAPSPRSIIKNVQRTGPADPVLGQGRYTYMSAD